MNTNHLIQSEPTITEKLVYREFLHRETQFQHFPSYEDDMYQYVLLREGDPGAIALGQKIFEDMRQITLSDNSLQSSRYMFVANATLATRFAIEGGLEAEKAYNISDLFIDRMDKVQEFSAIKKLQKEMISYFLQQINLSRQDRQFSQAIHLCLTYIDNHLHQKISVTDLSRRVYLTPNYLSVLFKKEVGQTISFFIAKRRIQVAQNMLQYSGFSISEIAQYLAFGSQSYFDKQFKKHCGLTPSTYRKKIGKQAFTLERYL